ncbi:MAG: DUF4298 domain-containing protein [Clostridia bacterium]|nr:DUF4298 domain-containing protein [Clostridia bacterium]
MQTPSPADSSVISEAIRRIERLEALYNLLLESEQHPETARHDAALLAQAKQTLTEYYESPLWMQDYQLDEQGLLPKDLRRGILSEDGLYNLLYD